MMRLPLLATSQAHSNNRGFEKSTVEVDDEEEEGVPEDAGAVVSMVYLVSFFEGGGEGKGDDRCEWMKGWV